MQHPQNPVVSKLKVMLPYSNNIDIPLTGAHPFHKGLIKQLNYFHQKHLNKI